MKMKTLLSLMMVASLAACANSGSTTKTKPTTQNSVNKTVVQQQAQYPQTVTHNNNGYTVSNPVEKTAYGSAPAMYSRKFECANGLTVHTTEIGGESLGLHVTYGQPEPATAILVRIGNNSYTSRTGVFGNGSTWQESGNTAKFGYGNTNGAPVSVNCTR